MIGHGVTVRYRDESGTWVVAGEVNYPKMLIARHQPVIHLDDLTIVLEWNEDNIRAMLAVDRNAAETIVAVFGLK